MNTYLVQIVFRIENKEEKIAQFDEQLRIVRSETSADAYEKAIYLALAEEGPVNNINGMVLHWNFVGITSLVEIKNLPDKTAVHSSTRETIFPQAYEHHIREKQQNLILSINEFSNGQLTI